MKKPSIWLVFILYLLIFVIAGVVFYFKYLNQFLSSNATPIQMNTLAPASYLYYSEGNNLYRFEPTSSNNIAEVRLEPLLKTGKVNHFVLDKTRLWGFYELGSNGKTEIWQIDMADKKSTAIASSSQINFQGFENFSQPKISPDNTKLALVGKNQKLDVVFIKNLSDNSLLKLGESLSSKISDYSWTDDSKNILLCSSNLLKNACWQVDLKTRTPAQIFEAEVRQISAETGKIIYLAKTDTYHLFNLKKTGQVPEQIDNLTPPKEIVSFQTNPSGQKIVYEVKEGLKTDIYESDLDGANRLQLTTDGTSSQPLYSPDGQKIAFLKDDGLYWIGSSKSAQKILNLAVPADYLLNWR